MELHFTPTNGPADETIEALIRMVGGVRRTGLVRELILASLKAGQENDEKADLKLMNTTLKEMRFTAKIFGPYRHIRKVSVFGSARTPRDTDSYRMAQELGRLLAARDYMVITGGGPGIIHAVKEGAGYEHAVGINI
nr:Rossman fold protein, TIGR00730 family [Desulfobacterales bacterium]